MGNDQKLHDLAVKLSHRIDALRAKPAAEDSVKHAFRAFANQLPEIVWTAKANGQVTFFNQRYYDFTGSPGCNWQDVLHPDDFTATCEAWGACVASGRDYCHEARFLGADGNYHRGITRAHSVRDDDGNIIYWIGSTAIDPATAVLRLVA